LEVKTTNPNILASANGEKRVEELELETRSSKKELESEKQVAREEAWAKVSVPELEINAAIRDLDFERQRLKGSRGKLMLRGLLNLKKLRMQLQKCRRGDRWSS
ncbi:hypothetical protein S83_067418, partial [Arachis hypogaea]